MISYIITFVLIWLYLICLLHSEQYPVIAYIINSYRFIVCVIAFNWKYNCLFKILSLTTSGRNRRVWRQWRSLVEVSECPVDRDQNLPRSGPISVFTQPNTLPGAKIQLSIWNWYRQIGPQETRLYVSRLKVNINQCNISK